MTSVGFVTGGAVVLVWNVVQMVVLVVWCCVVLDGGLHGISSVRQREVEVWEYFYQEKVPLTTRTKFSLVQNESIVCG